ncbi:c-type cytochrome [Donghicola eburneus]|uniref:c-type cytochrome n=1 Tax=Donghicola eburneus TaxID=393278 RepID=UPI0008E297BB|nr:cytochrome c [Donghicola eburneus]SFQ75747.1 Cytochrome c556 [Donghicola eburneus]
MKKTMTFALIAFGTAALAHGGVKDKDVMARMEVMKAIGDQVKVIGTMAKGERAFDADAANAALAELAVHSAQIAPLFETPAQDPKSEALPIIWEQWDDFAALAMDTEQTASALAGTITTEVDLRPALGRIGGTCKACHSTYRE